MNASLEHLTSLLEDDIKCVWDLPGAVELCQILETIAPNYGAHVALTGGCLYKDGRRKDVDIMFYRIRQVKAINEEELIKILPDLGITILERNGWVLKALYENKPVDFFFPEESKITADGKCKDDQYPSGPTCPSCGMDREQNIETFKWIHSKKEPQISTPVVCSNFAHRSDFIPSINVHGQTVCPNCGGDIFHDYISDTWNHFQSDAIYQNCILCSNTFTSKPGQMMCDTCYTNTINGSLNPNFVGNPFVNNTVLGRIHGYTTNGNVGQPVQPLKAIDIKNSLSINLEPSEPEIPKSLLSKLRDTFL